ncbi:MAG: ATP-binding cassette domain-containing protein [Chloroflexota bacterium]
MEIEVRGLTKTFGPVRANDGISLRFEGGKIHGVLGENGAGKSTLMKLLSGFLRRDAGEILLDGRPVDLRSPADALREGVGMIHQDPLDVPAFSALENFYLGAPPRVMRDMRDARRKLMDLAGQLGFSALPDTPIARLTVGQRQQLELMRLLAWGARVLILDEPTTGITAAQIQALFRAVKTLAASGTTVLFVSHKLEEVAELCATVSVLRAGKVAGAQLPMPQPKERLLTLMFGQPGDDAERQSETEAAAPAPLRPAPQPAAPVWQLEDVVARAGTLELAIPSLTIESGTALGLAGIEGSGQQILLRLLAGRLRPLRGRIAVDGVHLTGAPQAAFRRAGVEYLPADRLEEGVVGALSLADHFALLQSTSRGLNGQGSPSLLVNRDSAVAAARAAIQEYAIRGTPDTPLAALSGGNQQRAMLSLLPPRLRGLLLEQPTRGLDVASAAAVWRRLEERKASGTALVFASADLDEVLDHSDYVLVCFAGQVSRPIPRAELSYVRLAEMIGGVGFEAMEKPAQTDTTR